MSWFNNIFVSKTKDADEETIDTSAINMNTYTYSTTVDNTYLTGGYYGTTGGHSPTTYTIPGGMTGINTGIVGVGTTTFPYTYATPNNGVHIYGNSPYIATDKNKIDIDELAELMKTLKERLLIIVPDFEKHEKYEALKKAYDHYKLIESMLGEDRVNNLSK